MPTDSIEQAKAFIEQSADSRYYAVVSPDESSIAFSHERESECDGFLDEHRRKYPNGMFVTYKVVPRVAVNISKRIILELLNEIGARDQQIADSTSAIAAAQEVVEKLTAYRRALNALDSARDDGGADAVAAATRNANVEWKAVYDAMEAFGLQRAALHPANAQ